MDLGDVAGGFADVVALGAVIIAAWELHLLRRQSAREREVEKDGVAVMWRAFDVPTRGEADGTSVATYQFTAYNHGKLPVREVEVRLQFPVEVHREHNDVSQESPSRELVLDTPVIAGGQHMMWERKLRIAFEGRARMRDLQAAIGFVDLQGTTHTNHWGRRAERPGPALR